MTKTFANPNDKNPLVTLALFAYNQENYIREAVESVLAQTYEPIEIILSDDCSLDNTYEIMKSICSEYKGSNKVILRKTTQNQGLENHINQVWEIAKGEWIVVAAGDDSSLSGRVSVIMDVVKNYPLVTLISSGLITINSVGDEIGVSNIIGDAGNKRGDVIINSLDDMLLGNLPLAHGATLAYSRILVDSFSKLPKNAVYEDAILLFRSMLIGEYAHVNYSYVKYRIHEDQTTNVNTQNVEENNRKRLRNAYGAYITSIQYLDDYRKADLHKHKKVWKLVLWVYRRHYYCKYRYFSLLWIWPLRVFPYFLALFLNPGAKDILSKSFIVNVIFPNALNKFLYRLRVIYRNLKNN